LKFQIWVLGLSFSDLQGMSAAILVGLMLIFFWIPDKPTRRLPFVSNTLQVLQKLLDLQSMSAAILVGLILKFS
jgi:hypothetical protein